MGEAMRHSLKTLLVIYLSVWTIVLGLAPLSGYAMLMPSDSSMQRQSDLTTIQSQLESKLVTARLNDLGLTSQEVQAKMQGLTDEQIHTLAQNMDGLQVGGEATWVVIAIIAGAVFLVVLLISAVTGTAHDAGHAVSGHDHP
jgi:Flp pilus assembly protein TadB